MRRNGLKVLLGLAVIFLSLCVCQLAKADTVNLDCYYCGEMTIQIEQPASVGGGWKCTQCGMYIECFHGSRYPGYRSVYEFVDEVYHIMTTITISRCYHCLYYEVVPSWKEETKKTNHIFIDGICDGCGYSVNSDSAATLSPTATPKPSTPPPPGTCAHPSSSLTTTKTYTTYEPQSGDDQRHRVVNHNQVTCTKCGTVVNGDKVDYQVALHDFGGGSTCIDCGYNKSGYYMSVDQGHINGLSAYVGGGQGATINVTSNVSWTAVPNDNWIHINNWTGTGNGSFSVSVDANNGYARESVIRLVGTHGQTIEIKVSQDGAMVNPATCKHDFVFDYDNQVSGTGKWKKVNDTYHIRESLEFIEICSKCGAQQQVRRNDTGAVNERHTFGTTSWTRWMSNETKHSRNGKKTCTAPGCGLTVDVKETGEHEYVKGMCVCGHEESYDCELEGHINLGRDRACDECGKLLEITSYEMQMLVSMEPQKRAYFGLADENVIRQAILLGASGVLQRSKAILSFSPSKLYESSLAVDFLNLVNFEDYSADLAAELFVNYIADYDVDEALSNYSDSEVKLFWDDLCELVPVLKNGETLESVTGAIREFLTGEASAAAFRKSLGINIGIEAIEQLSAKFKARVVRNRIEAGVGGVDSLPSEIRQDIENVLDGMENGLVPALIDETASTLFTELIKEIVLTNPKTKLAQALANAGVNYIDPDDMGLLYEKNLVVCILAAQTWNEFTAAVDRYNNNPSEDTLNEMYALKNTYIMYAKASIKSYNETYVAAYHSKKAMNPFYSNEEMERDIENIDAYCQMDYDALERLKDWGTL